MSYLITSWCYDSKKIAESPLDLVRFWTLGRGREGEGAGNQGFRKISQKMSFLAASQINSWLAVSAELDQTLCSKSEQKFSFMTKPPLPNLQKTVANTILIINSNNSNNLKNFWVGIFTRQGHMNQVY